jgi:hypothetical protein
LVARPRRSGAHDLSTGGPILNQSFATRRFRRPCFCGCHSAASAFLCHGASFWFLYSLVIVARQLPTRRPLVHGGNPVFNFGSDSQKRNFEKGNEALPVAEANRQAGSTSF